MGNLGSLWGVKGAVGVVWNTSPSHNFSNYNTSFSLMCCELHCLNFQPCVRVLTYIAFTDQILSAEK